MSEFPNLDSYLDPPPDETPDDVEPPMLWCADCRVDGLTIDAAVEWDSPHGIIPLCDRHLNYREAITALRRYADEGMPLGNFLWSVVANDLLRSFQYADEFSAANLRKIVEYVGWEIPAHCWGSPERVQAHLELKRRERQPA